MMAPAGSKGDGVPGSTMKPTFLAVLFQVTVVPAATQKGALLFAFWVLGVEEAPSPLRFTLTIHGVEDDPHVLDALHNCAGFGSIHTYLLPFDCALATFNRKASGNDSRTHPIARHR
jgi:hypothetical protein